jgi:peptide/nickel transport system substrate-binding protein
VGTERDHPAAALTRAALALAAALALLLGGGCGDGGGSSSGGGELPAAGGGGELVYAIPRLPRSLDPLLASTRVAQTISRQVHEPLVARIPPPYGQAQTHPGLALSVSPSADRAVWTLELRPGVSFQDGSPFNAEAVRINAQRWLASGIGRRLLPGLFAVDSPRPGEVRFLCQRPLRDLDRRLRDPRLGIVSPRALTRRVGSGLRRRAGDAGSGTGPFELSERLSGRLRLERSLAWWGAGVGLGPALDDVVFVRAPSDGERLRLLRDGDAQVADPLDPATLAAIESDPLLTALPAPGGGLGLESSVRGIDSALGVPLLSRVWLTTLEG